jgi:myo-inositol-1(or 4)-monophosphatase
MLKLKTKGFVKFCMLMKHSLSIVNFGRFDAYFEFNLNSYDVAAGIVLVREAGGQIFDFTGGNKSIERREMLATNGLISAELLLILDEKFN